MAANPSSPPPPPCSLEPLSASVEISTRLLGGRGGCEWVCDCVWERQTKNITQIQPSTFYGKLVNTGLRQKWNKNQIQPLHLGVLQEDMFPPSATQVGWGLAARVALCQEGTEWYWGSGPREEEQKGRWGLLAPTGARAGDGVVLVTLGSVCPGEALSLGLLKSLWGFSHGSGEFVVNVLRNTKEG